MPPIDALVEEWQHAIAPLQMAKPLLNGPLTVEMGGGASQYGTQPHAQPSQAWLEPPKVVAEPHFDANLAPEFALLDGGQLYWWQTFNPYQTSAGSTGDFREIPDPAESSILPFNPSHPLGPIGGPVTAQLLAPDAPYGSPTEAQLYMVDPAFYAAFLKGGQNGGMPTRSTAIAEVVGGPYTDTFNHCSPILGEGLSPEIAMPPAVSLMSPEHQPYVYQLGSNPWTAINDLEYSAYYGDNSPPAPNEVRAVAIHAPGLCSAEFQFAPLYAGTKQRSGLLDILKTTVSNLCGRAAIQGAALNYLFATPVIDRDGNNNLIPRFFLNADLSLEASVESLKVGLGCNLRGSTLYDVAVDNGKLVMRISAAVPDNPRIDAYSGGGCDDINLPTMLLYTAWPQLLSNPEWFALEDWALQQGGVWASFMGPNSLIRDALLRRFLRQDLNQIFRSLVSIPFGDFGSFLSNKAGAQVASAFNFPCNPTLPLTGEYIETGDGDVPGDKHLVGSRNAPNPNSTTDNALRVMCRLVRQGFMRSHSPNGPPFDINDFAAGFGVTEALVGADPCSTLVSDSTLWSKYNTAHGTNGPIPVAPNTDEFALDMLLNSLFETDERNTLKHWGCPTPCDPSESANASFDLVVRNGVLQLNFAPDMTATFSGCAKGCKSTLSSVLGGTAAAATTFGRFQGCDNPPSVNASPADPTKSLVTFYPPIRRIIVNPDGIQVVFIDNENDWTNAALAARYALTALDNLIAASQTSGTPLWKSGKLASPYAGSGSAVGPMVGSLCSYVRPPGGFITRKWATLRYPEDATDCPLMCGFANRACVPQCKNLGYVPICSNGTCECALDPNIANDGWSNNAIYHACLNDSDCPTASPHCINRSYCAACARDSDCPATAPYCNYNACQVQRFCHS